MSRPSQGAGATSGPPVRGCAMEGAEAAEAAEAAGRRPWLATAFYVGGALCALDASLVDEVVRLRRTTPVPHAPPYIRGVMNLRGKIVSILDLASMLGMPPSTADDESRLYIVRDGNELVGVLVDRSADVIEIEGAEMEPPPGNVGGVQARFMRGVARAGDRLAAVLDPAAVLSVEDSRAAEPGA